MGFIKKIGIYNIRPLNIFFYLNKNRTSCVDFSNVMSGSNIFAGS